MLLIFEVKIAQNLIGNIVNGTSLKVNTNKYPFLKFHLY